MNKLSTASICRIRLNLGAAYAAMLLAEQGARAIRVEPPAALANRGHRIFSCAESEQARALLRPSSRASSGRAAAPMGQRRGIRMDRGEDARASSLITRIFAVSIRILVVLPFRRSETAGHSPISTPATKLVSALGGIYGSQWALSGNPVALHFPAASYSAGVLGATATVAALCARDWDSSGQSRGQLVEGLSIGRRVFASDWRHHAPRKDDPHV